MGHLLAVSAIIGGILAAALSNQLTEEFKAWTPWITKQLITRSAAKLPKSLKDRYEEEWTSHIEEVPGQIGKLIVAAGFLKAAMGIQANYATPSLTPPSTADMFGLLPEPEGRWGSFGVSLVTNLIIMILLVSLTAAIRKVERPTNGRQVNDGLRTTPCISRVGSGPCSNRPR